MARLRECIAVDAERRCAQDEGVGRTPRRPAATVGVWLAAAAAGATAVAAGCSLLQSYDGYLATDATAPADAGAEAGGIVLGPCTTNQGAHGLCAPPTPPGWSVATILYEGPATDPPQVCAAGYTPSCSGCSLYASLNDVPATCAACSCDPSPVQCATWLVAGCPLNGQADGGVPFVDSGCYPVPSEFTIQMAVGTYAAPFGSCAVQGGDASVPSMTWQQNATACIPTAQLEPGTCGSGETCLAQPPPPFPAAFCVSMSGDVSCPAGSPYSISRKVYAGATDTRGCAPCACGAPDGGVDKPMGRPGCVGSLQECPDDACAGNCYDLQCKAGIENGSLLVQNDPTFQGGCEVSGGQPTGSLTATGATTFCCTQ
jgi:hypothetical protein